MNKKRSKRSSYSGEEWDEFYKEFQDKNDRAVAIIGATMLDESLGMLLTSALTTHNKASTVASLQFSKKIDEAHNIGLITDEQRDDLNIIREIRNMFAHELDKSSFEDVEIVEWCKALKIPSRFTTSERSRDRFTTAVAVYLYSHSIAML